jgi:hypothetical protein
VQPPSAQVRVSPKARTIGSAPAARRLPLRLSTVLLAWFPHPSRANSSRPRHPPPGRVRGGRVGSVKPARVLLSWVLGAVVGLGGWAWPEGSAPGVRVVGCRAGPRPASPDRRAGRGVQRARWARRSAAVDPGPGGRLAVIELLARVGGSSVTANWPAPPKGGRHVDMVVGADHCGRAGVGVRRDAASGPLTARRQRPGPVGGRARPSRQPGGVAGRSRPSGRSRPPAVARPGGLGYPAGVGPVVLDHREQFVAGVNGRDLGRHGQGHVVRCCWLAAAAASRRR